MRLRVRVVGRARRGKDEQGVVRVEHLSRELDEEVSREAARVLPSLPREGDMESALHLVGRAVSDLLEGVLENVVSADVELDLVPVEVVSL